MYGGADILQVREEVVITGKVHGTSFTVLTIDEFWNYTNPEPPAADYQYKNVLSTETPIT